MSAAWRSPHQPLVTPLPLVSRGQMGEAVYAHMTTNALIAAYVLCFGRWSMWS